MKKKLFITIGISAAIVIYIVSFISGYVLGKRRTRIIVHYPTDETELTVVDESAKYPFLPKELSDYIVALSSELKIDPDLAVAHLMVENPKFNPEVSHRNPNGSSDEGLWQINNRYCYSVFVPAYWDFDIEFNIYNWKHNTFIALHLIEDLNTSLKIQDDAIMAYNCGIGAVMNHSIPSSTYEYLAAVKNNLELLKKTSQ